ATTPTLIPYTTLFRSSGIIPIARENNDPQGAIITKAGSGASELQHLRWKSLAFPEANDALTVWAKARLVDVGILKKDLGLCTNRSEEHTSELQSRFDL